MGQKVHPIGFRLGIIKTWSSKWYEEKNYAQWLHEDIAIREAVKALDASRPCKCGSALAHAMLTDRKAIPAVAKKRLAPIVGKYVS